MSTFAGRATKWSRLGRVNSDALFAYNKGLKDEALKEKTYWDVSKDSHPINRWSWVRWSEKRRKEGLFEQRINSLPPDQASKHRSSLGGVKNAGYIVPLGVIGYFIICYVRYSVWGVTPQESTMSMFRMVHGTAKAPPVKG
eukprot:PhM_4_TR6676/c0_g1_i1/m.84898